LFGPTLPSQYLTDKRGNTFENYFQQLLLILFSVGNQTRRRLLAFANSDENLFDLNFGLNNIEQSWMNQIESGESDESLFHSVPKGI
jgi:hypothetical protein